MKRQLEEDEEEKIDQKAITGDVIGDTAYSERFVLRILLKFANENALATESRTKEFEDELCTLWDMTAERDVVFFLNKHNIFNIFQAAFPAIRNLRVLEIMVGIVANMCCVGELVPELLKRDELLHDMLDYVVTDDTLLVIQVLRLMSACVFAADEDTIRVWFQFFKRHELMYALDFILKNSADKDLLLQSLETLNTVFSHCNRDKYRNEFFTTFVSLDAMEGIFIALNELIEKQKDKCSTIEIDRIAVISLQMMMHLIGFDKSKDLFMKDNKNIANIIECTLDYYEEKLLTNNEIDADFGEILDSMQTAINTMKLSESSTTEKYFEQIFNIWTCLMKTSPTDPSDPETKEAKLADSLKVPLCNILCEYISNCSEECLKKSLDKMKDNYDIIIEQCNKNEIKKIATLKSTEWKEKSKDGVKSEDKPKNEEIEAAV